MRTIVDLQTGEVTVDHDWTPPPPPPPYLDSYRSAISAHLDSVARERQYDSALTIVTYVASTNPLWAAEASAFIAWRDAVWTYAFAELEKVQNGDREAPSVSDFISELPAIEWPEL